MMFMGMIFSEFTLFGVFWISWIHTFVPHQIWKNFSHAFFNYFSYSSLSPFMGLQWHKFRPLGIGQQVLRGPVFFGCCCLTFSLYILQVRQYLLMYFMFTDSSFLCHLCSASKAIHWTPYHSVPNVPSEFLHCFSAENFHLSTHLWGRVPPHRAQ